MSHAYGCREQISQQTDREALHLAEVIQLAKDSDVIHGERPEAKLVSRRKAARRNARLRAAATLALMAGGAVVLAKSLGRR
jgi:hypothetical protein